MAMGRRKRTRQQQVFVDTSALQTPAHPFYQRLNAVLREHEFDDFVEQLCARFYDEKQGRPSVAPGVYFRMLLVGYFEGIDSERGIAWRCADSLALREFLGLELDESPPDHSSVSRTRRRLELETHKHVFQWILGVLAKEDLVEGQTIGIDATTLEANAALRSIVRRDGGESYDEYLDGLAKASGIETPTRKDRAKIDKNRPKKGSNDDWKHPKDPDARITKMKDGRTHLAHKVEHSVDMRSGAVVAVTVQEATLGDSQSLPTTMEETRRNLETLTQNDTDTDKQLSELVLDRGYHSNATMTYLGEEAIRSYASEPDRGRRRWHRKREAQRTTYANRRRIRGDRGKALQRKRGELLERSFAHTLETGAMRRVHLRNHENILKRMLVHVAAFNLGLIMRKHLGHGTPRGLPRSVAQLLRRLIRSLLRLTRHSTLRCRFATFLPVASATGC